MKLKDITKQLGLTKEYMAEWYGISWRHWYRIEKGEIVPSVHEADKIWKFLVEKGMDKNINLVDLFR